MFWRFCAWGDARDLGRCWPGGRWLLGVAAAAIAGWAGCAEVEAPALLAEVTAPAVWRVGTPLQVAGRGLAGRALRVGGVAAEIRLQWAGQRADGLELAWGHVPSDPAWREGQTIAEVCLSGDDLASWRPCRAVDARLTNGWQPQLEAVEATEPWRWGQRADLRGADLLLPGEGQQRLEVECGGQVRAAAVTTRLAQGRTLGEVVVSPLWLGAEPGARSYRARVVGTASRGDGSAVEAASAWSAWKTVEVQAPQIALAQPPQGLRRGDWTPVVAGGVADDGSWQLEWSGQWRWRAAQLPAEWVTPGGQGGRSVAASLWWQAALPWAPAPDRFVGEVRLAVIAGDQRWTSAPLQVVLPLWPTLQRVEIEAGAAWRSALARLGLLAHAGAVEAALLQRLREHFSTYELDITLVHSPHWDGRETLRLRLGDLDGNGLHLLGAEAAAIKDVGNRVLDEQLSGFDQAAWAGGQAAIPGVFVGEVLGFSKQLHPDRPQATAAFDAVFGPWCPALGGKAAAPAQAGAAAEALRQLAWAVAETCAHEIGHALGLAAGSAEAHHPSDHPGWIMDSGGARPWAERAGLAGAAASQWGPVDAAYLQQILPKHRR